MASITISSTTTTIRGDYSAASVEAQDEILVAQAEVVSKRQRALAGSTLGTRGFGTGGTRDSVFVNAPKSKDGVRSVSITFKGVRVRGKTTTSNAAIAFFNEYGVGSRMEARRFISRANEEAADECAEIAADLFAAYVASQI